MSKENSQNTHPSVNEEEKNLEILRLKQQVAINLWIQAFAQFSEAIATTKLFFLEE
jgi:hypothetical protein